MGIMDMFSNIAGRATTNPVQQTPPANMPTPAGNIPAEAAAASASAASPGTASNGLVPASTGTETKTVSPLDAFSDLWQTPANANQSQPLFNVDQAALLTAAKTQDFTKLITPEQLDAIGKGGSDAMAAFAGAINAVAQDTYARSAFATTKLIEGAITKNNATMKAEMPEMIKQHHVRDGLRTENPAFSHAAAQPLINALEQQMLVKFPNATAQELRQQATQYLEAMASIITKPAADVVATAKASRETDWTKFF